MLCPCCWCTPENLSRCLYAFVAEDVWMRVRGCRLPFHCCLLPCPIRYGFLISPFMVYLFGWVLLSRCDVVSLVFLCVCYRLLNMGLLLLFVRSIAFWLESRLQEISWWWWWWLWAALSIGKQIVLYLLTIMIIGRGPCAQSNPRNAWAPSIHYPEGPSTQILGF